MLYKRTSLSNLANYINGMAFKPSDWKDEGVKIIRIEQLNNPKGDYDYFQGYFPESNAIDNEDLIFSWSATLKVIIWKYGKGVLNQHLFKVISYTNTDKYFLHQLLDYHMDKLAESSHGSTMKHIKREELGKYRVVVPTDMQEQSKIANILSTCDKVIEKTEEIIEKYKQIKVGIMQDLFTRGLDENGKLRPTYAQAPDLYKYYEKLDRYIPKEWDVKRLDEVSTILSGKDYKGNPKGNCNVPIYGTGGVMGYTTIPLYSGPAVLTGRKGSINNPYYVEGDFWNVDTIFCLKMLDDNDTLWFFYQIYITDMTKYNEATGVPSTTSKTLNKISFAVPKSPEQIKIAQSIIKFDKKIEKEEQYLNKYKQIKQGLMKRLLTPPADAEIVEE